MAGRMWIAAVLGLAILACGARGQPGVDLLGQVSGAPAGHPEGAQPDAAAFDASKALGEARSGRLHLVVRSIAPAKGQGLWFRATVEGDPIWGTARSVSYTYRDAGREKVLRSSDGANRFAVVAAADRAGSIQAKVTVRVMLIGTESTVVLDGSIPDPARLAADGTSATGRAGDEGLPAGVTFEVRCRPAVLEGGADSGLDDVSVQLKGDPAALDQIEKVEYDLDRTATGSRARNFFHEGIVSRPKWPITARVFWKNGNVTTTRVEPR